MQVVLQLNVGNYRYVLCMNEMNDEPNSTYENVKRAQKKRQNEGVGVYPFVGLCDERLYKLHEVGKESQFSNLQAQ